jgi:hypothetical protein
MSISRELVREPGITAVIYNDHQIVIPFRDSKLTRAALKQAAGLIAAQDSRVRLIDVQVVPYGVALDSHTVEPKYLERRLKHLARDSGLQISTEIVYARNWEQGLRRCLTPQSTVLLPMRRAWWQTSEKRFAARLRRSGHTVVWVECD